MWIKKLKEGLNTIHPPKVVTLFSILPPIFKNLQSAPTKFFNENFQFVNVANPLVFFVCSYWKGIRCVAPNFFDANVSILPLFRQGQLTNWAFKKIMLVLNKFELMFNEASLFKQVQSVLRPVQRYQLRTSISDFVDKYKVWHSDSVTKIKDFSHNATGFYFLVEG
jgi:hypothetical protein